jgi:hypothetical protein
MPVAAAPAAVLVMGTAMLGSPTAAAGDDQLADCIENDLCCFQLHQKVAADAATTHLLLMLLQPTAQVARHSSCSLRLELVASNAFSQVLQEIVQVRQQVGHRHCKQSFWLHTWVAISGQCPECRGCWRF